MQAMRDYMDARGMLGPIARLDFLQADNQMRTFSKETGGMAFFPRFEGEMPNIFRMISDSLRNQYTLTYQPSNTARDGKFRRIKVGAREPRDQRAAAHRGRKGQADEVPDHRQAGYTAPREVE